MEFRSLTHAEIEQMIHQGCSADQWEMISVRVEFVPDYIRNVEFRGEVQLGISGKSFTDGEGITRRSGIFNASLEQCVIESDVFIRNVGLLARYHISPEVVIDNVGSLTVTGESNFGNGIEIEILNEGGGRELPLMNEMSAQLAYLLVHDQHDKELIRNLRHILKSAAISSQKKYGVIGKKAVICHTPVIENVNIGNEAKIKNVLSLKEGTILSEAQAQTVIENGTIAHSFIIQQGAKIKDGVLIDKCLIGQNVKMGKQYSAENSAFFANCEAYHGEGVALFAGPYTVTHHKSTLLIAAQFSFYNAGSGTNQSNHMYKLGPLHQGILERGAKTGSFSYLLWPSRIGAFTAVVGKHTTNFDGSEFPFSYISEEGGRSILTPAMNLFTVGTRRDSDKWPKRDGRKAERKYDRIHFTLFNPVTIGNSLKGQKILRELIETASPKSEWVQYKGLSIKRLLLKTTSKYYEMAIRIFSGEVFAKALKRAGSFDSLKAFIPDTDAQGQWVDLLGMLLPAKKLNHFTQAISDGHMHTLDELNERLDMLFQQYEDDCLSWAIALTEEQLQTSWQNLSREQLSEIFISWSINRVKLNNMILKDAEKEFDQVSKIGFGIDGDELVRDADFEAVRGTYDENSFVRALRDESAACETEKAALFTLLGL